MKTKATITAIIFLMLTALSLRTFGQEQVYMEADEGSSYSYLDAPRNEIGTSIGVVSAFGGLFDMFKLVFEGIGNSLGDNKVDTRFIGTYGFDYYYQVNSWFRPGAKFVYEGLATSVYDSTDVLLNHYHTSTMSVMPSVEFSYLNKRYVKLYSGIDLGVGVIFDNNKKSSSTPSTFFAFNITPIGVRFGNENIYGMVETNIGVDAMIKAGFGARF